MENNKQALQEMENILKLQIRAILETESMDFGHLSDINKRLNLIENLLVIKFENTDEKYK